MLLCRGRWVSCLPFSVIINKRPFSHVKALYSTNHLLIYFSLTTDWKLKTVEIKSLRDYALSQQESLARHLLHSHVATEPHSTYAGHYILHSITPFLWCSLVWWILQTLSNSLIIQRWDNKPPCVWQSNCVPGKKTASQRSSRWKEENQTEQVLKST